MTEAAITLYITDTFLGVSVVNSEGNGFFFYDPPANSLRHLAH